jgi:glycosyltransferase involved in cell wall biosynthesis
VVDSSLRILTVSTSDFAGGAERVAWNLFHEYRRRGYQSNLAVGYRKVDDPNVFSLRNHEQRNAWFSLVSGVGAKLNNAKLKRVSELLAEPIRAADQFAGLEDFNFPGAWKLLELTPERPSLIHCHNLHGDYFDLRALPWLSNKVPVVVSLHDAWLLSGHCAHSFDCERWRTGCGECPDLTIYPAIRRDATARNWQRKQRIFARSKLYVSTACQWLMNKVNDSVLAPGVCESRIIPYGVDLSVFRPHDRIAARKDLGLPEKSHIILFAANRIKQNIWKDYDTMRAAIARVAIDLKDQPVTFVALGEDAPAEQLGTAEMRFYPFHSDINDVARFYQAANLYLHGARIDTFPNAVLEALACGTPVVATAVGGIPEQIDDGRTGFLVPPADVSAMASRIVQALDADTNQRMSAAAAQEASARFSLDRHVEDHLKWYKEILTGFTDSSV